MSTWKFVAVREEDFSGFNSLHCGCIDVETADSMTWQIERIGSAQECQWQTSISHRQKFIKKADYKESVLTRSLRHDRAPTQSNLRARSG